MHQGHVDHRDLVHDQQVALEDGMLLAALEPAPGRVGLEQPVQGPGLVPGGLAQPLGGPAGRCGQGNGLRLHRQDLEDAVDQGGLALGPPVIARRGVPGRGNPGGGLRRGLARAEGWNGVAILARWGEAVETRRRQPGDADDLHSRYLEGAVQGVLVGCLYLPDGNPAPGPKFDDKLRWLERFAARAAELLQTGPEVVLAGDTTSSRPSWMYTSRSVGWTTRCSGRSARRLKSFSAGLDRCPAALNPDQRIYTFWDYLRNDGPGCRLRIDHLLLSPSAAAPGRRRRRSRRTGWEKTSDHAPVWIELDRASRLPMSP